MRLGLEIGLIRPVADRRQLTFFARTKKVSKEMRRNTLPLTGCPELLAVLVPTAEVG